MELYNWHQMTCISPIELAEIVRGEVKEGRIQLNENKTSLSLTDYGHKWLEANGTAMFTEEKEMPWKKIPEEMAAQGDALFDSLFIRDDLQHLIDHLEK